MFLLRDADKGRVEIDAIHGEALSGEKPGVLARAARHVKNSLALRGDPT